jgi:benzoyl-CoA 2,3-dioxygenase component B
MEDAGRPERLFLPHEGFNRKVGAYAGHHISPPGEVLTAEHGDAAVDGWLPTPEDRAAVARLMVPHYEPGEFAGWITAPKTGINDQPVEFDYVHLAEEALA